MNMQPWRVHVLTGEAKAKLSEALAELDDDPEGSRDLQEPYDYYPREWFSPYMERRRKVGWDLYGLLGIAKGDKERMHMQHGRNYRFFDAPVGLFFTVNRELAEGKPAGLRHVPAERDDRSEGEEPSHLSSGSLPQVPSSDRRLAGYSPARCSCAA